jgi:hypothetical protein
METILGPRASRLTLRCRREALGPRMYGNLKQKPNSKFQSNLVLARVIIIYNV